MRDVHCQAWLLWLFIHLMYLVGFRNRLLVFVQWMWNYCTFRRGVRFIVGHGEQSDPPCIKAPGPDAAKRHTGSAPPGLLE
jgi:NADH:quinone reductase (non-electrogenic)